jgi:hypothetical protein
MKLVDLNAQFVTSTAKGWRGVETLAEAQGVLFDCPACTKANGGPQGTHCVLVWFRDRAPEGIEPGPGRWTVSEASTGLGDLTLGPSVQLGGKGCRWHGFVIQGEASTL